MKRVATQLILNSATATGAGEIFPALITRTFHGYGTTASGSGSADIDIQVSNDGLSWITAGTIQLHSLATSVTADGLAVTVPWKYVRANVTAISGTGASVSVIMGTEV